MDSLVMSMSRDRRMSGDEPSTEPNPVRVGVGPQNLVVAPPDEHLPTQPTKPEKVVPWIEYLFTYRYHLIPVLILLLFLGMIIVCLHNSPDIYRQQSIFYISSLGNWQEGVAFFSFFMTSIAILMLLLFWEVNRQRTSSLVVVRVDGRKERLECRCHGRYFNWLPEFHSLSAAIFMVGLIITGCFPQSFRPWHYVGVMTMMLGFVCVVVCDFCHYFRVIGHSTLARIAKVSVTCARQKAAKPFWVKLAFASRIVLSIVIGSAAITFFGALLLAEKAWDDAKHDVLEGLVADGILNTTQCPEWDTDLVYTDLTIGYPDWPNYYPCKSDTLWAPEDPGWTEFKISALSEMVLFSAIAVYSFTYTLFELPPRPHLPKRYLSDTDCIELAKPIANC